MRKEQYFIITTLVVGIITALPNDKVVFEIDSPQIPSKSHEDFASKLPSQDTCGKRKAPNFQIVGESDSDLGAWPWMVALGYKYKDDFDHSITWLCDGTLISKQHILTATYCSISINTNKRTLSHARLGALNLYSSYSATRDWVKPLDVPIERVIRHKEYNSSRISVANNIGLVLLKNDITFNTFIQPICLPLSPDMKNIDMGNNFPFIAGWGRPDFMEIPSSSLMEAQVPIIDTEYCQWLYRDIKTVMDDRVICAGEPEKDTCVSDSGGPLMWLKEKQFYLIGIQSYGKVNCRDGPGVYTKVSSYINWILENI